MEEWNGNNLEGYVPEEPSPNDGSGSSGQMPPYGVRMPPQPPRVSPPTKRPKRRRGVSGGTVVASSAISVLLSLSLGYAAVSNGFIAIPQSSSLSSLSGAPSSSGEGTAAASTDWTKAAESVQGSVVSVMAGVSGGTQAGSGVVIDATNGYIVTNNHVIEGANAIKVSLSNGNLYETTVKGTDVSTDIAVLRLKKVPSGLKAVTFADSGTVRVGTSVLSIGNPLGYSNTATSGIISALNRPVEVSESGSSHQGTSETATIYTNAIQIDSSINQGNSGGPSFVMDKDDNAVMIGLNSSIATATSSTGSSSTGSIGIGFAIPSNLVKRVSTALIEDGKVSHPQLGVTVMNGVATADGVSREGALVKSVTTGGSAAAAGLKANDIIVGFNGISVGSSSALIGNVRSSFLGDSVKLTIVRGGKTLTLATTLDHETETTTSKAKTQTRNDSNDSDDDSSGGGLGDWFGKLGY